MDTFSLNNFVKLSDTQKGVFNKVLAQGLASILDEVKSDGDLNTSFIDEFIASSGKCSNSESLVQNLYSKITSGVQVGSGNQNLFLGILSKYTEAWETINR